MPSSLAALNSPIFSSSMSSVKGEYSTWMAEMGCTAWARRSVAAEHSERPRYLTFPSLNPQLVLIVRYVRAVNVLDKFRHRADGDLDGDGRVGTLYG